MLRGGKMVVKRALQFVAELRLAGEPQQLQVELDPSRRHARLADVGDRVVRQCMVGLKTLPLAGAACEVEALVHDVLPGIEYGLEHLVVAGDARQFAEADEVGEHLVGFAVGHFVDLLLCEQRLQDCRSLWLVPRFDDVSGKVEVTLVARQAIEQHDRLQHAGGGHAEVRACGENTLLGRERCDEQVAHLAARVERGFVAGVLIVAEQADEVVFVRPHVPVGAIEQAEALFWHVGAQITVRLLGRDQLGGDTVELLAQCGVTGVGPCERGGVHPLADVLADPRVTAGLLAEACKQWLSVHNKQKIRFVSGNARAKPAIDADCRRRQHFGGIRQLRGHLERQRSDGIRQRAERAPCNNHDCQHTLFHHIILRSIFSRISQSPGESGLTVAHQAASPRSQRRRWQTEPPVPTVFLPPARRRAHR